MIILFFVGILAGIITGMGIGGGAILIPTLTIFLGFEQKVAQSINLIYFIPTAIIAIITHKKSGNLVTKGMHKLMIFGVIGAIVGAIFAINLNNKILKKIFGSFILVMGLLEIFKKGKIKMSDKEFEELKQEFINADVDKKIEIYVTAEGLTQMQYKELLKAYPYSAIDKLEQALA